MTSIAFETDDEEVNAGPWLVTIQSADGSIVTTGPWEHAEALAFAESLMELQGVAGQAVVEPLFERPDLDTAREFLTENVGPRAAGTDVADVAAAADAPEAEEAR
ncbi:MAG TPA: hypothetical protein VGR21_07795 [Cryptosporangiaceae bacterium]|nr:hypothetical protein [Cryptosporangiaceae bacterium]